MSWKKGTPSKPRTDDQCSLWAYVEGDTWVCSKPEGHSGWHRDNDINREWTRGQIK